MTEPNKNGSGNHIKLSVILRLGKYLFRTPFPMILAFLIMIATNLLALWAPKLSGHAIDALSLPGNTVDFSKVIYYCVLMAVCFTVSALLSYLLTFVMIRISKRVTMEMRRELFGHLLELPVSYFDTHQTGDIISHISYDIDTINASLSNDLLQIFASIITVIGSLVMMLTIEPILVLIFAVTVPISIAFTRYKSVYIRPLFKKRSARLGVLNGYAEEILSGQKTVRAFHKEDVFLSRFDERNSDAVNAYFEADYQACAIGPSVNFINNLSLALISMFGTILYIFGRITPGNISTFILYSRKFAGPINEAANIISELQSACAAAERVFGLMDLPTEAPDAEDAEDLNGRRGDVEFRDVSFSYEEGKEILHHISFGAPQGTTVAIVGPTGSGKTTVINLLMRFYDIREGAVTIGGKRLDELTRSSTRAAFSMVLQDAWLFAGTVGQNIAYGKEGATPEEVRAAAEAVGLDAFIMSLPDGYDTMITDNGSNLSKGQKQMITIARAMVADSDYLILDEATSNVDSRTEQSIQNAMRLLMKGKTCFVIAHRLSTIQSADRILVLRGGRIEESGTHEELLQSGGFYSSLYLSQFH